MRKLNLPGRRITKVPAMVWKRIAAFLIDLLVLNYVILSPLFGILTRKIPVSGSFEETFNMLNSVGMQGLVIAVSFYAALISLLYFFILEMKFGQTIGKIIMNIYIISEEKEMKVWQVIIRSIFIFPFFPFVLLWVIDPIFMFITQDKKRLSEILSRTRVIENIEL